MARRGPSRIHTGLTGARGLVGSAYLADAGLRREYEAEIAPRTGAALAKIFAEVAPGRTGVQRALDLGAGTGAAGVAVRAHFGAAHAIELVSVDKVAAPGVLVADLRRPGRPAGVLGRFDLVVAAHLLNELSSGLDVEARAALVASWGEDLLDDGGLLVLLEPALRETSRGLLAVRDRLLARGFGVVAPCFFAGPCPALSRERDWCHDAAPWGDGGQARPGRSRVDFSHLVLRRRPSATAGADERLFRVVSDPMPEKGRLRIYGCGSAGRHLFVRLDRDRTAENAALDTATRGDVLEIDGALATGEGLRLTREAKVALRPAAGRGGR